MVLTHGLNPRFTTIPHSPYPIPEACSFKHMQILGKSLVAFGIILALVGLVLMFSDKIPFLGKLPGDIHVKKDNFEFWFPITTSIVLSLLLSGILWVITYFRNKGG